MAIKLSERSDIPPFAILGLMQRQAELIAVGQDVISLGAGLPSEGLPRGLLHAAQAQLDEDPLQAYTPCMGTPILRGSVADSYNRSDDLDIDRRHVAVTPGSSIAIEKLYQIAFNPGDRIVVCVPGYPPHASLAKLTGLECVRLRVGPKTNYQPTVQLLDDLHEEQPLDGLVICSPCNPTGTMLGNAEMKRVSEWCVENDIRQISDEAYRGIEYDDEAGHSALRYNPSAVALWTASKYYRATGWRVGGVVSKDEALMKQWDQVAQNAIISTPTLSQFVFAEALKAKHNAAFAQSVQRYRENRDVLIEGLQAAGILKEGFGNAARSDGAFYMYADTSHITDDSYGFAMRALEEQFVSFAPGTDFDPKHGHKFARFTYAGDPGKIQEACGRLKALVDTLAQPV